MIRESIRSIFWEIAWIDSRMRLAPWCVLAQLAATKILSRPLSLFFTNLDESAYLCDQSSTIYMHPISSSFRYYLGWVHYLMGCWKNSLVLCTRLQEDYFRMPIREQIPIVGHTQNNLLEGVYKKYIVSKNHLDLVSVQLFFSRQSSTRHCTMAVRARTTTPAPVTCDWG